jgi:RNA polymerase sigma-70 factor (ECF subfamily)
VDGDRQQDANYYAEVIERYSDMVLRIAYQNTFNKYDAEDIAQEVFIKFLRQGGFASEEHLKAWFIRVTINQCKDWKKAFWRRSVGALGEEWPPFSEPQNSVLAEIKQLPAKYRNVIYLYYFEGYAIREIADIMQTNPNTVSSWLVRARKKLKALVLE